MWRAYILASWANQMANGEMAKSSPVQPATRSSNHTRAIRHITATVSTEARSER